MRCDVTKQTNKARTLTTYIKYTKTNRRVAAKPLMSVEQVVKQSAQAYSNSIIWGLKTFGLA
jgi:hypothetical protein